MDGGEEGGAEVGVEILVLGHLVDFLPFLLRHLLFDHFGCDVAFAEVDAAEPRVRRLNVAAQESHPWGEQTRDSD